MELRNFADFLRSCEAAMVHIKSLEILNDCNENRKILSKLPDQLIASWNCKVIEIEEEKCRSFMETSVKDRVKFVQTEKLCFGCLKTGHHSKGCNSRIVCERCKSEHPTCLHERSKEEENPLQDKKNVNNERPTPNNHTQTQDATTTATTNSYTLRR